MGKKPPKEATPRKKPGPKPRFDGQPRRLTVTLYPLHDALIEIVREQLGIDPAVDSDSEVLRRALQEAHDMLLRALEERSP